MRSEPIVFIACWAYTDLLGELIRGLHVPVLQIVVVNRAVYLFFGLVIVFLVIGDIHKADLLDIMGALLTRLLPLLAVCLFVLGSFVFWEKFIGSDCLMLLRALHLDLAGNPETGRGPFIAFNGILLAASDLFHALRLRRMKLATGLD